MTKTASTPKVSILVPIYNVEKYLKQCLDSVVDQTLREIEIICLNDGSTDHSLQIVEDYARDDDRFVIVDKKNSGYGDSMNLGLKKATGEYIGIVESDDYAERDMFENLYDLAKANDADVVKSNFFYYLSAENLNTVCSLVNSDEVDRIIDPRQNRYIFYEQPSIWAGIYRRAFLEQNGIDFLPTPGASFQDTGFNFKVWSMARRAYFSDKAYLHYRIDNEGSSVKDIAKARFVYEEYADIEKYLREHGALEELGGTMEFAKFGAFYWNLERMPKKLAEEYLPVVSEEFLTAERNGLLDFAIFDQRKAKILQTIMYSPERYFTLRRVYRLRDLLAKCVKRILPTKQRVKNCLKRVANLLPAYRQQQFALHVNENALNTLDQIITRLDKVEKRLADMEKCNNEQESSHVNS